LHKEADIRTTETGYDLEVPVPGFKPDQIDMTYKDGFVSVAGNGDRRAFSRSLVLPEEVDADKIEAKVEHGLLTLTAANFCKSRGDTTRQFAALNRDVVLKFASAIYQAGKWANARAVKPREILPVR
jgi:HSP20 family molecular chaperone IbpA